MSSASSLRVPELVASVDVRRLPLSALEGFVLSRIDGRSSAADIVSLTGLPLEQVVTMLDKLVSLGAVRYRDNPHAFDPPSGSSRGRESLHPGAQHGARPRKVSYAPGSHHQPRRMLSESAISQPPPEAPSQSTRPRKHSDPPPRPSHPPTSTRPQSSIQPAVVLPSVVPPVSPPPVTPQVSSSVIVEAKPAVVSVAAPSPAVEPPAHSSLEPSALPAPVPLYDPRELEEQAELPPERRKQVLDLFYLLPTVDYYEALGVPYQADKKEIRSAYFALSKQFHPDSLFRKNLGSFKSKMEIVFKFLTEAYETLSKKKTRDEYDAYLRSTKAAQMAERALHFEPTREPAAAPALPDMQVPPPPPLPNIPKELVGPRSELPAAPTRPVSDEARKLAQEVIARRLRGVAPPARPAMPTQAVQRLSTPLMEKSDPQSLLANLTRTLRDVGQLTGGNDRITRAVRASQAAVERGDLAEATQQAARAASLAPDRHELKAEHVRLSGMLAERLANDYIEQAKFEMKQGKWASAALTWSKVCEGRPQDATAHRFAAQSLLKGGGEMRTAQRYAQKAVFLAPTDIDARILLAQIHLTVGLKLNARRELDAAAKLDPANEMVKNLLADLEKG